MPAGNPYYAYLLRRYMEDRCTPGEREELFVLLEQEDSETHWHELISEMMEEEGPPPDYDPAYWEPLLQSILQRPKAKVRNLRVWYAAAAVAALVVVFAGWFLLRRGPGSGDETASAEARSAQADVEAPTINKAIVTLSDGRTVSLDSIQNGLLANQNGIQLIKQADGQIQYLPHPHPLSTGGEGGGVGVMNTLTNPRGSKVIDMVLSDGSHVWLNAGSSITYPVVFTGNERRVLIKGEGYFEVAKDKTKPFYVQFPSPRSGEGAGGEVMVLGTHFNVNAYDDEADIRVTLLEGKVSVSAFAGSTADKSPGVPSRPRALAVTLSPGQQAIANSQKLIANSSPDLEQVMAWKNGRFQFTNATLEEVLREISRWYDLDVRYSGKLPNERYRGKVSRSLTLMQLIKVLELNNIKTKLEGKTLIISY